MIPAGPPTGPKFPKHFDGKRFYNPNSRQVPGFLDVLRWKLSSRPQPSPRFIDDVQESVPPRRVEGSALRITLINHSTVLLQQHGLNILTDPIWSERASPLSWIGPPRHRKPGVRVDDLPPIDLVLLSHNHYDHLDMPTLRRFRESIFVVPIGVTMKLEKSHQLDWGESFVLGSHTIHAVPAMHFSARGILDRNKTLWCGYIIETPSRLVYFAGDTGFGNHFAQIREAFGSPHVALLPIGAYEPRWFMSPVHMAPHEAAKAHQILGAKTSIAIHHGTFQLADESLDAPKRELLACAPRDSFLILDNGEFVEFP